MSHFANPVAQPSIHSPTQDIIQKINGSPQSSPYHVSGHITDYVCLYSQQISSGSLNCFPAVAQQVCNKNMS